MPQSIQPSAIDDSFEFTPTMSWTRPAQQVEYQHYVEPGDARSAIDDRTKTEYGFVPDRPSFPIEKNAKHLARNLGRTIVESKKAAAVIESAKSNTVQAEVVKAQSTIPKPSSRPRPIHRYKHIVIRGKDGRTDIRRNPFHPQRDARKTQSPIPAPDPPKLQEEAMSPVVKSSSSSGKQKVRIVSKDGQERIMRLSMPLRYDNHSPSVTKEKSVKSTAPAQVVEKRHATPVKVDQMSHTARQDESSKRSHRQQPQYHDRPTEAKQNINVKNEEKVVTKAQNSRTNAPSSRTNAATEPPRRTQPPVSEVISEVKCKDSVSVRMSNAMPISSRDSKVHSTHDSGVAFGSDTSVRGSATSKDTSRSSRSSRMPTNKTSSMVTYPGGGRERNSASHASEKAAQKVADACSKVYSKAGTEKRSEASNKSTTPVVDGWGIPPSTSNDWGKPTSASHSSKKDDIPPMPSQSTKTSKTSHMSTKHPSTPRDGRDQTSQSTIQSYREFAKSSRSSGSSNHQAAFSTRSGSFAGSSRNGSTTYARPGDITPHPLSAVSHGMSDRQPPQVEPAWDWDDRARSWGSQYSHHTGMLSHEPPSSRGSMASGQSRSKHSFVPSTVPDIDPWDRVSQTPTIPYGEPGYVPSAHGSGSRRTHRQPIVESVEPTPLPHDEPKQREFWFDGGSSTPPSRPRPKWAGNRPSQVEIPKGYESTDPMKPSPLLNPYPYHYDVDPFKTNTEGVRRHMRARKGKTGSRVDQLRHISDTSKP